MQGRLGRSAILISWDDEYGPWEFPQGKIMSEISGEIPENVALIGERRIVTTAVSM